MIPPEWDYAFVALASGAVGVSELIERFRDEPLAALRTLPALGYIVVNGVAGAFALLLIRAFGFSFGADGAEQPVRWGQAVVAAFGAVMFLRSAFFVRSEGDASQAYGPGRLFERFLQAQVDRIDRIRGVARDREIDKVFSGVPYERAASELRRLAHGMLPNASAETKTKFDTEVDSILGSDLREPARLRLLGHAVLIFGGTNVLRRLGVDLRADQIEAQRRSKRGRVR